MRKRQGFTIIEVVLVLAIAGLIFLMVFIALPALQRSQRNTQRKNDINRILTAFNAYKANNSNKLPFASARAGGNDDNFASRYIDEGVTGSWGNWSCSNNDCGQFSDPDGELYNLISTNDGKAYSTINGTEKEISQIIESLGEAYNQHSILAIRGVTCSDNEDVLIVTGVKGNFALVYALEGGAYYCVDNS